MKLNVAIKYAQSAASKSACILCLAAACLSTSWLAVGTAHSQSRAIQSSANSARAIALVKEAEAAFLRGDYNRTILLCRQATAANPRYPRAYTWMGAAYEKRGQMELARQAYGRVLSLSATGQDATYVRARLSRLPAPPRVASGSNGQRVATLPAAKPSAKPTAATNSNTTPSTSTRAASNQLPPPALPAPKVAPTTAAPTTTPIPAAPARVGTPAPPLTSSREVEPAQVPQPPVQFEPEIDPQPEPDLDSTLNEPVDVTVSPEDAGESSVIIDVPRDAETPRVVQAPPAVAASRLLTSGRLYALPQVRVQNKEWTSGVYRLSGQDQDLAFDLNREWEWFEVRIAVADNASHSSAGLWGWFNDKPARRAFHYPRVLRGQAPILVRVPVANATSLTLAPTYPGNGIILIEPRFIRRAR